MTARARLVLVLAVLLLGCGGTRGDATATGAPAKLAAAGAAISPPARAAALPPHTEPAASLCTGSDARFSNEKVAPKPLTEEQARRIADAEAYLRDHPRAAASPMAAELAEKMHRLADACYEARRWREAAIAYRELAMSDADAARAVGAAVKYLEAINVLGSSAEPPRVECYDVMARDVPEFFNRLCWGPAPNPSAPLRSTATGGALLHPCLLLYRIELDLNRSSEPGIQASEPEDASTIYEKSGGLYLEGARRCCAVALRYQSAPKAEKCDRDAYYAGKAFALAGLPARAGEALAILKDPKNGLEDSALTTKLTRELSAGPGR